MKWKCICITGFLFVISLFLPKCSKKIVDPPPTEPNFTDLSGDYLGQTPPGLTPERFAPDLLTSTASWWWHDSPVFSPDGQELYFDKYINSSTPYTRIDFMRSENDRWTAPSAVLFSSEEGDDSPRFTMGGDSLFFTSRRSGSDIYFVARIDDSWSTPERLTIPGTESNYIIGISLARDLTIYFGLSNGDNLDVYRTRRVGGQYIAPENLGNSINTNAEEWGPYIDPDEEYIIYASNRSGGYGLHDLYISFQNPDGSWSDSQNMGSTFNSTNEEASPLVSPDGEYLFFNTARIGDLGYNPYWVSAQIINDFRPVE